MLQARSLCLRARKESDDLTSATVPAGTSLPAAWRNLRSRYAHQAATSLLLFDQLNSVPSTHMRCRMTELARDGNLGLAQPVAFGEPRAPSLQRRPFRHAGQKYAGRLEQIHAEHGVSTLGYSTGAIELSRCMTPGR